MPHLFRITHIAVVVSVSFAAPLTKAEYRAFLLEISNSETGQSKRVTTTFDHIQYPSYYPLSSRESIQYVDSWMCWENTNKMRPICPQPEREPASPTTKSNPEFSEEN